MVCEADTPRGKEGCNLQSDVTFIVGGEQAGHVKTIDTDVVSYLGKKLCVLVNIPDSSSLTTPVEMAKKNGSENLHRKLANMKRAQSSDRKPIGVSLEITVTNSRVTWNKGPCSIAHVLWEQAIR